MPRNVVVQALPLVLVLAGAAAMAAGIWSLSGGAFLIVWIAGVLATAGLVVACTGAYLLGDTLREKS